MMNRRRASLPSAGVGANVPPAPMNRRRVSLPAAGVGSNNAPPAPQLLVRTSPGPAIKKASAAGPTRAASPYHQALAAQVTETLSASVADEVDFIKQTRAYIHAYQAEQYQKRAHQHVSSAPVGTTQQPCAATEVRIVFSIPCRCSVLNKFLPTANGGIEVM
jgi:hypothetical protein